MRDTSAGTLLLERKDHDAAAVPKSIDRFTVQPCKMPVIKPATMLQIKTWESEFISCFTAHQSPLPETLRISSVLTSGAKYNRAYSDFPDLLFCFLYGRWSSVREVTNDPFFPSFIIKSSSLGRSPKTFSRSSICSLPSGVVSEKIHGATTYLPVMQSLPKNSGETANPRCFVIEWNSLRFGERKVMFFQWPVRNGLWAFLGSVGS